MRIRFDTRHEKTWIGDLVLTVCDDDPVEFVLRWDEGMLKVRSGKKTWELEPDYDEGDKR